MQTGLKIAFVNLRGRQHRAYSIAYRPQLMKLMFLHRLDPNAICNPLSITKSTVTCTLKNTVFRHSAGKSINHPTEKNHELIRELILDNSNEGDIVLDCCCGSGGFLQVAKEENRHYIGIEINKDYYQSAVERLRNVQVKEGLYRWGNHQERQPEQGETKKELCIC